MNWFKLFGWTVGREEKLYTATKVRGAHVAHERAKNPKELRMSCVFNDIQAMSPGSSLEMRVTLATRLGELAETHDTVTVSKGDRALIRAVSEKKTAQIVGLPDSKSEKKSNKDKKNKQLNLFKTE